MLSAASPARRRPARKVGAAFVWRNTAAFSGAGRDGIDVVLKCDGLRDFDSERPALQGEAVVLPAFVVS